MPALESIAIAGYKSIQEMELELRPLNILIGANGAGKSNFIGMFRFLRELINENLQLHVTKEGGADTLLYFGSRTTAELNIHVQFSPNKQNQANAYECTLIPSVEDTFVFADERTYYHDRDNYKLPLSNWVGSGHIETKLHDKARNQNITYYTQAAMNSWRVYHFHDTSGTAKIKLTGDINDNDFLRSDASNLAAYLYRLQEMEPSYYRNIVETVRLVAPFFDTFVLRPSPLNPEKIRLEWREKGSDAYFNAHALSDGTLRFISLATLLLQPPDQLPTTILLDEPELGLHPYAINVLSGLLRSTAQETQIIVSTQSVTLVNQFDPEDLIIVERENGASTFRRPDEEDIAGWLEGYSLGELWEKNVLGGRP